MSEGSEIGRCVKDARRQILAVSSPFAFEPKRVFEWKTWEPEQVSTHPPQLDVEIRRNGDVKLYPFTDFFRGFDKVEAVRSTFGPKTDEVLESLKVEFFSFKFGYMAVSDVDGHILISTHHLRNSDFKVIYLDLIHELVHVKQFMDGRRLFNSDFEYVDNPTEIEAYRHAVKEAKRIGMTDEEISEYLEMEWLSEASHRRLVETVGLKVNESVRPSKWLELRI